MQQSGKPDLRLVLEHYGVELRGERREMSVLCPIHQETRPSCSVNLEQGVIHCQSCGFGGDSYSIIMKKEGLSEFRAAVRFAEEVFGVSGSGVPQPARRHGPGVPRNAGARFKPKYRNSQVRTRPLSSP